VFAVLDLPSKADYMRFCDNDSLHLEIEYRCDAVSMRVPLEMRVDMLVHQGHSIIHWKTAAMSTQSFEDLMKGLKMSAVTMAFINRVPRASLPQESLRRVRQPPLLLQWRPMQH
jgi:hypothetical protein